MIGLEVVNQRFVAPCKATLKRRDWTTSEDRLLRERYAATGPTAMVPLLHGRTYAGIAQRARILGLKAPAGTYSRRQWPKDERIDAAIRLAYQKTPERGAIDALAAAINRPRWWVSHRAAQLGCVLPRFKQPAWSAEEDAFLGLHAHRDANSLAQSFRRRGWHRTATAIAVRRKRLHLSIEDPDHYTAHQLSELMGVDGKTITVWIAREGLPAKRRGTKRTALQGGDMWRIARGPLRQWIATHAQLVDLRKVDRYWFIDFAFGRRD